MYFKASNNLVPGGKPIFLGVVKQGFLDVTSQEFTDALPLTAADVQSIKYSVFKEGIDAQYVTSMRLKMNPVPGMQEIPIEITAIKPFDYVKDWVYEAMKVTKFKVNFVFIPANMPPIFAESGEYELLFVITDINGEEHPCKEGIHVE